MSKPEMQNYNLDSDQLPDQLLTENDNLDIKKARENPRVHTMVRHIDSLVEKSNRARAELSSMIQTSLDLKDQSNLQKQELKVIEEDQKRICEELTDLRLTVVQVSNEKATLEKKLQELKVENDELESFLTQAANMVAEND